ncbi:hypothetical protein TVAG_329550 [Trichomonas vaginalis G3]|uniref:Uncharacterized protein n=1 Tax=Trichomonas vaginalis (strain ATCC PRA-98 / G3) TaxID=412133 RepID=A2EBC3_TRIV3|nr:hypothetical protein TVAGG3_0309470 [Trichomonas vaginalis G3]EAY10068.1 hypothetical protein TVAG_329550 [Trichomonas vaginalis G3]KAI5528482.1 hypothetical protein TVAGG3_0309470 [Trichomonas vaginalis G3]|eukprot:XP_001322291.1 hypothetical protein [Trichomonas vaginalis G3]
MVIFLLFAISNCISCCIYTKSENLCPKDDIKVPIHNYSDWDDLKRKIENDTVVIFNIADSIVQDNTFFDTIRLGFSCNFSIVGLNQDTKLKFDALAYYFSYDITLMNIMIYMNSFHLSAKDLILINTKFNLEKEFLISCNSISSDLTSLPPYLNLQTSKFQIISNSSVENIQSTIEFKSISSNVDIDIINSTENIDFGAVFRGFSILLGKDNKIQINPFQCSVNMTINMIAPNRNLILSKYFISRAIHDSSIHFNLIEPTNVYAVNFRSNNFDYYLIDHQNVQFYVHAFNDINFESNIKPNLINFDLVNSNATFEFSNNSYIQRLDSFNSNITFISTQHNNYKVELVYSDIRKSTIKSSEIVVGLNNGANFSNSYFYGHYVLDGINFRCSGVHSYFQNVEIVNNMTMTFAHPTNNTLQIDNFINDSQKNLGFVLKSGSTYYSNFICSHQKDFIKNNRIRFSYEDSIMIYDILNHESETKGEYCIDLKRIDNNQYKENLKMCHVQSSNKNCPSQYIQNMNFDKYYANESSSVNIFFVMNNADTIDLSQCHKNVAIEWINSNSSQLDLTIIGTSFITLELIGINAYFSNEIECETLILRNSNVNSKFSADEIKFDQSSSFIKDNLITTKYELLNYSPKIISFEEETIKIDHMSFINNETITIDNNLAWNTEINLNYQSPGFLNLINTNPRSYIIINSMNPSATNKLKIDPCGIVAFRSITGKIPIIFSISSETEFLILNNDTIYFDNITINNSLNFVLGNEINVLNLRIDPSGHIESGFVVGDEVSFGYKNYQYIGNVSISQMNFDQFSLLNIIYKPKKAAKLEINLSATSIPYIEMEYYGSIKGKIDFNLVDDEIFGVNNNIADIKVPVLKITNAKCKNWKMNNQFKKEKLIDIECMTENNITTFYIARKHILDNFTKAIIIIISIACFGFLAYGAFTVFVKLKRKSELKYLNKIYEEQSTEQSLPEKSDDSDAY